VPCLEGHLSVRNARMPQLMLAHVRIRLESALVINRPPRTAASPPQPSR
jgi:hypothetical protein